MMSGCHSAPDPNAYRRRNLLIGITLNGSTFRAYSQWEAPGDFAEAILTLPASSSHRMIPRPLCRTRSSRFPGRLMCGNIVPHRASMEQSPWPHLVLPKQRAGQALRSQNLDHRNSSQFCRSPQPRDDKPAQKRPCRADTPARQYVGRPVDAQIDTADTNQQCH